jgi:4-amino-4-deoxy-L-arabinose transferase-like glycosyltransferase
MFREAKISLNLLRFASWAAGTGLFAWALFSSRFRDGEGFLQGAVCLPVSAGVALIVVGYALTKKFRKSALWFALALVGQAVALQMIDAGPAIKYQHYKPLGSLLNGPNLLLLTYLIGQTILVAAGLTTHLKKIRAWVGRNFKLWQIAGVGLVFLVSGAAASRDVKFYSVELLFAALVQTTNLANILLAALSIPGDVAARLKQRFDKVFGHTEGSSANQTAHLDTYAVTMALWVAVVAAVLNFYSYERHPHVADEVVYLYHSRLLAQGALTMPAPPVPEAFDFYLMDVNGDRWYPSPPPGWPAILAVGTLVGLPWLVNPLLAGINVLLAYIFLSEVYDRRTARMALLLLCVSPWHVFMAMNFMTHTFTLTCALVAAVAVVRARKTDKAYWGWIAGCAIGVAGLIRPLEGLVLGALIGLWVIGLGGRRLKTSAIAAFVLGAIMTGALVLEYNKILTGHATVFPLNAYIDKEFGPGRNDLGFGPNRGMGWSLQPFPGHSPLGAMVNADLNLFSLNIELFGWSTGSLILAAFLIFCGKKNRSDYLMYGVIAGVFGVYVFYWYSGGPDFGARYWYLMLVPCVALTVRAIQFFQSKLESGQTAPPYASARVTAAVLLLSCSALVNYFPWRAVDKYHHYLNMRPDIRKLARDYNFGKSLVLIRGNSYPDYASAAIYNPLDHHADAPVYVWDGSPEVRFQVLEAYRDRPVWIIDGHSITGRGFRVIQGPLSAQELIAESKASGNHLSGDSDRAQ